MTSITILKLPMKSYWAFLIGGVNHQNVQKDIAYAQKRSALGLSLYSWLANRFVHRLDGCLLFSRA